MILSLFRITPSVSLTSPGVSQWTVNENSYGTQTTQTDPYWGIRGDSFDSSKSYSMSLSHHTTDINFKVVSDDEHLFSRLKIFQHFG